MIIGSLISIFSHGIKIEFDDLIPDLTHASNLFANTVFIFVAHHSIAGIVKPVRPQKSLYSILFYSFAIGGAVLWVESALAAIAFTRVTNSNCDTFPWEIQSLYNENFTALPFIGQVCNFYPALNVAAVPILTITLRNNLFVLLGIEAKSDSRIMKALWSVGLSIPVIICSWVIKNPQIIMTYVGGIGGTWILFLVPCVMIIFARRTKVKDLYSQENFNKCFFQHIAWPTIGLIMAVITFGVTIYGIVNQQGE